MNQKKSILDCVSASLPSTLKVGDGPLIVALSGGADSVCLLLALRELGFTLHALHCNFELRGVESDGDEAFVRRLCREQGVELTVKHFRTRAYATRQGLSIEMAARELRYEWFGEMASRLSAQAVCVAHHRDDNVETMLMRLVRGTGLHGLTGMKEVSMFGGLDGFLLLRPLLGVARSDIEAWLEERGQRWVVDSTNLDADAALRNKIRLQLLPLLEQLNPRISDTLAETALRLRDAEAFYREAVDAACARCMRMGRGDALPHGEVVIDVETLRGTAAPRTALFELLHGYGFTSEQVADIFEQMDGEPGHVWETPSHRLLRDRGVLVLSEVRGSVAPTALRVLPLEGLAESGQGTHLLVRRQALYSGFVVTRDSKTATFDLDKLSLPLTFRLVAEGDRIRPFGMEGSRLVSDVLTDLKLNLFEKERQQVVCDAEGRILWIVGRRVAAGAEVDDSTRHVMTITLLD